MSKGSKRRPQQISNKELNRRWNLAFSNKYRNKTREEYRETFMKCMSDALDNIDNNNLPDIGEIV